MSGKVSNKMVNAVQSLAAKEPENQSGAKKGVNITEDEC